MKEYYVYAIVSEKDSLIYVGIATDCEVRPFRIAANKLYRDIGFVKRETNVYRYFIA
jgi:predicted GIY-YIG superfamily endonuclease